MTISPAAPLAALRGCRRGSDLGDLKNLNRFKRRAAGLFAAIPAVLAYNHFTTQVKVFASDMDDFSLEFLNIAERNFT